MGHSATIGWSVERLARSRRMDGNVDGGGVCLSGEQEKGVAVKTDDGGSGVGCSCSNCGGSRGGVGHEDNGNGRRLLSFD